MFGEENTSPSGLLKKDSKATSQRINNAEKRISGIEDQANSQVKTMGDLSKDVKALQAGGISPLLDKILRHFLKLSDTIPAPEIERAHRALRPIPDPGHPPRHIIIRFLRWSDKNEVFKTLASAKGKLTWTDMIFACFRIFQWRYSASGIHTESSVAYCAKKPTARHPVPCQTHRNLNEETLIFKNPRKLRKIFQSIEGPLIIGGDFNSVCDPIVDRSSHPLPSDKNISAALRDFQSELGITDVWRLVHPDAREYSFYSGAHNSYSRIDYIIMSSNLIQNVIEIKMHSILLSDHAAVSVTFFPPTNPCKSKQWRLNTSLLKNEKFALLIKDQILDFFEINLNSVPSVATVWEAFKATCRGWLISFSSAENKKRRERKSQLNFKLKTLEEQHMLDPSNLDLRNSLLTARTNLQKLVHEETAFALFRLRRTYFESGDKAGKMLAHRLKQIENRQIIPAIRDEHDRLQCDAAKINESFKNYYSKLYSTKKLERRSLR
ncbi:hypothetical protein F7725_028768 [Dissostichus mawsoni]|uniref:Endonuclease/exonuclease/phosphatase domain-containing protein n=1 Tax=Dissostichus mawsoni TaxID=36200 RepID=A0A7J5XGX0_DISMA|nr:hypothetical protein F7725_028768 [Dissostichus mawsoni]